MSEQGKGPPPTRDDLLEALIDMVAQHCAAADGSLDSRASSTNAFAMRVLAQEGKVIIEDDYGRRVIARWVARES